MSAQELIQKTLTTCRELNMFLEAENTYIEQRDVAAVEENIERKNALVIKLENLLKKIRESAAEIKADARLLASYASLKPVIQDYNTLARRNAILLQAAQSSIAGFLNIIRDAVQKKGAKTYGRDGAMYETAPVGNVPLVNRSI